MNVGDSLEEAHGWSEFHLENVQQMSLIQIQETETVDLVLSEDLEKVEIIQID